MFCISSAKCCKRTDVIPYWKGEVGEGPPQCNVCCQSFENPCLTILGKPGHLDISWLPESNSRPSYWAVWLGAFIERRKHWMSGMFARARAELGISPHVMPAVNSNAPAKPDYIFSPSKSLDLERNLALAGHLNRKTLYRHGMVPSFKTKVLGSYSLKSINASSYDFCFVKLILMRCQRKYWNESVVFSDCMKWVYRWILKN